MALTGVTATAGSGQATVNFTAPAGATSVKVQQSTDGTTWTDSPTAALTAASTSATVAGLTNGTEYQFRVVVVGGLYEGTSNVVTATPAAISLTIAAPTLTKTKSYDGDTTAAVTAGALTGVAAGDTVTVSAVATYDNANVGAGKTITVVYTLGGADAAKYTAPANTVENTGEITAAQAVAGTVETTATTTTISYTLTTGEFDATAATTVGNWTLDGADAGELGAITGVVLSNSNKTATITVTNATASGKTYTLAPAQAAMNANFTAPAAKAVTVN